MDGVRLLAKTDRYGRQPQYIVRSRLNHRMTKGDRDVLIAIQDRVCGKTWDVWVSHRELATDAHVDEETVRRSLKRLIALGVIKMIKAGKGRGNRSHLRLMPELVQPFLPLPDAEGKPRASVAQNPAPASRKTPRQRRKTVVAKEGIERAVDRDDTTAGAAAVTLATDEEFERKRRLLTTHLSERFGRVIDQLASRQEMHYVEIVAVIAAWQANGRLGTGMLVTALKAWPAIVIQDRGTYDNITGATSADPRSAPLGAADTRRAERRGREFAAAPITVRVRRPGAAMDSITIGGEGAE